MYYTCENYKANTTFDLCRLSLAHPTTFVLSLKVYLDIFLNSIKVLCSEISDLTRAYTHNSVNGQEEGD